MRFHFFPISMLFVCFAGGAIAQTSSAPTCADLHLVPAVRECTAVHAIPIRDSSVLISVRRKTCFGGVCNAKDLEESLQTRGVKAAANGGSAVIGFFLASTEGARHLLQVRHIEFSPAMRDEGYVIAPMGERSLTVIAATPAGMFYGAQTVKQLIRGIGQGYGATGSDASRLAGDGASRAFGRLVAWAAAEYGVSQTRNPHAGGIQVQHLLALLRSTRLRMPARRSRRFQAAR